MTSEGKGVCSWNPDVRSWTENILDELNEGLYERRMTVSLSVLAVLSGQSVFLYGPPGTAKSLIARRLSCIFRDPRYFEYLMQRFSTPEEVFGPISISELKKDNYIRMTQNYLPDADVAFLDEVWKSSPAILNTLLTIINERKFKNGSKVVDVPLKAVVAASNEFPAPNTGLDALYDRFIVRLPVGPLSGRASFEKMISSPQVSDSADVSEPISTDEWVSIIRESSETVMDPGVLDIIDSVRRAIADYLSNDNPVPIYVSDRRWQKAVSVLKTAAYLCGRDRVLPIDTLLLKSCLWSSEDNREIICRFIDEAVCAMDPALKEKESGWEDRFGSLELEMRDVFKRIPKTVRPPVIINNIACFDIQVDLGGSSQTVYVPYGPKTVGARYNAWDNQNNVHQFKVTEIDGNRAVIEFEGNRGVTATVPMAVGESSGVPESTRSTYRRSVQGLESELNEILDVFDGKYQVLCDSMDTPFVSDEDKRSVTETVEKDLQRLEGRLQSVRELIRFIDEYD